ncbi:hypothetical protein FKM82_011751 [Ascaphus truei]
MQTPEEDSLPVHSGQTAPNVGRTVRMLTSVINSCMTGLRFLNVTHSQRDREDLSSIHLNRAGLFSAAGGLQFSKWGPRLYVTSLWSRFHVAYLRMILRRIE